MSMTLPRWRRPNEGTTGPTKKVYRKGEISITDDGILERIKFNRVTELDLGVVSAWAAECASVHDELIDEFYAHILQFRQTTAIIEQHTTVERQRPGISRYLATFLQGRIDDQYVATRQHVGRLHDDIDLDSNWYVAMYEIIKQWLVKAVRDTGAPVEDIDRFQDSLGRMIQLDMGLVLTALTDSRAAKTETLREEQSETMNGLVSDVADAAKAGDLGKRADPNMYPGDVKMFVEAMNEMLDAIIEPITEAGEVLERVAGRDLGARMLGEYKGDHGRIKTMLNQAVENIDQSLGQVSAAAEQVASASGEISAGSQSLAQSTSEQASTLEEISSSLQEMSSMTEQTMANAQEANGLSASARDSAERGSENMKRLSGAMDQIKGSSDETAKIVKTIDEIAFQTNLLALNAAVEAARAGDAGKGFAVVAEEVRNLAMRSAEAAKTTAQLIEESLNNANQGVTLSEEMATNLEEIHQQVTQVSEVMGEITAAANQQSEGATQVTTAIEQMNQVTQQTAANAEQSSSASEELSAQAEDLEALVSQFQMTQARSGGRAAQLQRAAPALRRPSLLAGAHGNGSNRG